MTLIPPIDDFLRLLTFTSAVILHDAVYQFLRIFYYSRFKPPSLRNDYDVISWLISNCRNSDSDRGLVNRKPKSKITKKYHASSVRYAHHRSYFGPWSNFNNCDAVQANYFVRKIKTVINYSVYCPGLSRISIYFP